MKKSNDLKYCRQCWHIVITTQSNQPQSQHHYTSRQYWSFFRFVPPTRPRMALSAFSTLFCANTTQNQFQLVRTHDVVLRSQTCRLRAPVTTLLPLPLDGQPSRHSQHYRYCIMYQPGHRHSCLMVDFRRSCPAFEVLHIIYRMWWVLTACWIQYRHSS